jgi:hypothetical protein
LRVVIHGSIGGNTWIAQRLCRSQALVKPFLSFDDPVWSCVFETLIESPLPVFGGPLM